MLPELNTEIPGPESLRLAEDLRRYESRNVTYVGEGWPVFWERAAGANVWDVDGNRYIDLTAAFAVSGLGHGRQELVDAMAAQAGVLMHGMGDVHPTRLKMELCRKLSAMTYERWGHGVGKTVLANSGFEAVETALKTALLATGRGRILAFEDGYHGLGYGALMGTGMEKFRTPFAKHLLDGTDWLPFPRDAEGLAALEERLGEIDASEVGALLVEPIQGRGGVVVPPDGFLRLLREWCHARGVVLIFDEIYTGFHRTGKMFGCEWEGVVPDLICLGKAMSGGFPISACVGAAQVMDAWPESTGEALHTSTFLGHPVGCAMALEALRLHEDPETAAMVERNGSALETMLRGLDGPGVVELRGRGMMWGLELAEPGLPGRLMEELLRKGIFILPCGGTGEALGFSPPFEIGGEDLAYCGEVLRKVVWSSSSAQRETVPVSSVSPVSSAPKPTPPVFTPFNEEAATQSHRRRLPHWRQKDATYFVTFRLKDSLPEEALLRWKERRDNYLGSKGITGIDDFRTAASRLSSDDRKEFYRTFGREYQEMLDGGCGACVLRDPENAKIVADALEHFDGERYSLGRYVVMPNHVHVLIQPLGEYDLGKIIQSVKSFSARKINARMGTVGNLWQGESFDHIVRGLTEMRGFEGYIEENPVKARLRDGEFWLGGGWIGG